MSATSAQAFAVSNVSPDAIRQARLGNPKTMDRDLAGQLGISEAEFVAAWCGDTVTRIDVRVTDILEGLPAIGEVMALTRNESAVHEKIGPFENISVHDGVAIVLGSQIDLRIFPKVWAHAFAVQKRDGDTVKHSLQFFDASGNAVHKVHLRPASNLYAYQNLVAALTASNQSPVVPIVRAEMNDGALPARAERCSAVELRDRWSNLTDVHQFFGMLRKLNLSRRDAVHMVGEDFAWSVDSDAVGAMLRHSASEQIPIMCFVGSAGCIQIHSGPVSTIKSMGPWINVLDDTFHLHLRTDHVAELWAVRKPTKEGHVTSLEAYDKHGKLIIQFFGKRHEGRDEREDWRFLIENLPRISLPTAA